MHGSTRTRCHSSIVLSLKFLARILPERELLIDHVYRRALNLLLIQNLNTTKRGHTVEILVQTQGVEAIDEQTISRASDVLRGERSANIWRNILTMLFQIYELKLLISLF